MNDVKTNARPDFFVRTRGNNKIRENISYKKNDSDRKRLLDEAAGNDVKVQIDDSVKEFSRIKKIVDRVPEMDNRDKIARLKREIQDGRYRIDYDALADKMINAEFI